jgi:hypothetical protein
MYESLRKSIKERADTVRSRGFMTIWFAVYVMTGIIIILIMLLRKEEGYVCHML